MARPLRVVRLGATRYQEAFDIQQRLFDLRRRGACEDTLLFVEHAPSVYTLGRRREGLDDLKESEEELKARGVDVVRLNRGGRATWHGPGQLTFYPIVNFKELKQISSFEHTVTGLVHWWVRILELTVLTVLWRRGLVGWTCDDVGVWLGGGIAARRELPGGAGSSTSEPEMPFAHPDFGRVLREAERCGDAHGAQRKIAAIGVQLSRYCSMHGVAFNVAPDLNDYRGIVPCGLDAAVTSLAHELPDARLPPAMAHVDAVVAAFIDALAPKDAIEVVDLGRAELLAGLGMTDASAA